VYQRVDGSVSSALVLARLVINRVRTDSACVKKATRSVSWDSCIVHLQDEEKEAAAFGVDGV
jgi:hypothetical protein